jgi:ATP-dependent DNA ligase
MVRLEAYGRARILEGLCAPNTQGIVSKLKTSPYRSGRFDGWRKIKCPTYRRQE